MTESLADLSSWKRLALLSPAEREAFIARYAEKAEVSPNAFLARISTAWRWQARPKQLAPDGGWTYWFLRAGRGFGKTKSAAEWSKEKVEAISGCRFALVAPTLQDVRLTMVEGETGLLSVIPPHMLRGGSRERAWNRGTCELYLADETYFQGFSSEASDRLRGPQHHFAWVEEVSSFKDAKQGIVADTTFSNMQFGLRLGDSPQAVITSTPKANKLTKEILKLTNLAMTIGSSFENRDNLSEIFWETVVAPLVGTRTGRQEIEAEILDDVEGALWALAQIDSLRVRPDEVPPLSRVVVGVDPNASQEEGSNAAGIIVAGADSRSLLDRSGYVLADRSVVRASPRAWATAAVDAYYEFEADRIVAEKNNGGDMVEEMIKTIDPSVPVKLVWASRGKRTRAEPVAALYGEPHPEEGKEPPPGRVHHAGVFPLLEEEQTTWTPESESPDRMDAAVWALSELMLKPAGTLRSSVPRGRIATAGGGGR